jgi:hypothetical protein
MGPFSKRIVTIIRLHVQTYSWHALGLWPGAIPREGHTATSFTSQGNLDNKRRILVDRAGQCCFFKRYKALCASCF